MQAYCSTCDSNQDVELVEDADVAGSVMCQACGDEFVPAAAAGKYENYFVASVLAVEPVPKQSLKKVTVSITADGGEESSLQIVTAAKYIDAGWRVVVALEGAVVPAGAVVEEDADAFVVKPQTVGGVKSAGIICDSWSLGWAGGAKGAVQQLPESYEIGNQPPDSRPRA